VTRKYAAHLCVRNNLTTLECTTVHGVGDSVKVFVAKKHKVGRCSFTPA